MHTKPLSPSTATLNPDVVNILMVARDETLSGAALRASAISASWGIMNSLSGGYFGVWAPAAALAKSETRTNASFFISLSFPSSNTADIETRLAVAAVTAIRAAAVGPGGCFSQ